MLDLLFCGEFLLHIPFWFRFSFHFILFYLGSFCYTSHVGFTFLWGVFRTHPLLIRFYVGSFSYTSRSAFIFIQGVSLSHPLLPWFFVVVFLSGEFLLHIPCWFNFLLGEFLLHIPCWLRFLWGRVSLIHPVLPSFLSVEFVIRRVLAFFFFLNYLRSFSYTSRSAFIFIQGVSLTHPCWFNFLLGEFLLHIPCWLHIYRGSLSYTSRAGVFSI